MFCNGYLFQALHLLDLDVGAQEVLEFLLILRDIEHFVFHEAAYERSDDSCHFSPLLVVFGHGYDFLDVLQGVDFDVLCG